MSSDKIRLGAFLLPSAGATPAQYEEGFAGQNPTYYQDGLRDTSRVLLQAEELGFDFVAFSEHHFHVEGLELSNNCTARQLGRDANAAHPHRTNGERFTGTQSIVAGRGSGDARPFFRGSHGRRMGPQLSIPPCGDDRSATERVLDTTVRSGIRRTRSAQSRAI